MGRRQQQHLGRSTDDSGDIAGRDHQQDPVLHGETIGQIEQTSDESRETDRSEEYGRKGSKRKAP